MKNSPRLHECLIHFKENENTSEYTRAVYAAVGGKKKWRERLEEYATIWIRHSEGQEPEHKYAIAFETFVTSRQMMEMLGYKNKAKEKEEAMNTEIQAIKELLQQGYQVWQVAARLGCSEQLIRYRLRDNKVLRDCLSPTKSGKWEREEIEPLIELRVRGWKYSAISKTLRRTAGSIASQVVKHADQIFENRSPLTPQEIEALSPDLVNSLVQGRLQEIWDGLMSYDMTKAWKDFPSL